MLYIHCIFVKRDFRGKGIGSKLLCNLISEMRRPNPLFKTKQCRVIVTTARERYAFRQPSYFLFKGFKRINDNIDVGLKYWLYEADNEERLDIPVSDPIKVTEKGTNFLQPILPILRTNTS